MSETIDTGDVVLHGPSGETWTVAFVEGNDLHWCGWPDGYGKLSDCTLTTKATADEKADLIKRMAESREHDDSRVRWARTALGLNKSADAYELSRLKSENERLRKQRDDFVRAWYAEARGDSCSDKDRWLAAENLRITDSGVEEIGG